MITLVLLTVLVIADSRNISRDEPTACAISWLCSEVLDVLITSVPIELNLGNITAFNKVFLSSKLLRFATEHIEIQAAIDNVHASLCDESYCVEEQSIERLKALTNLRTLLEEKNERFKEFKNFTLDDLVYRAALFFRNELLDPIPSSVQKLRESLLSFESGEPTTQSYEHLKKSLIPLFTPRPVAEAVSSPLIPTFLNQLVMKYQPPRNMTLVLIVFSGQSPKEDRFIKNAIGRSDTVKWKRFDYSWIQPVIEADVSLPFFLVLKAGGQFTFIPSRDRFSRETVTFFHSLTI